jgi:hypothetical protein
LSNVTEANVCPDTLRCSDIFKEEENLCVRLAEPRPVGGYMDPQGLRKFDNFMEALLAMTIHMSGDGGMQDLPQAINDGRRHAGPRGRSAARRPAREIGGRRAAPPCFFSC